MVMLCRTRAPPAPESCARAKEVIAAQIPEHYDFLKDMDKKEIARADILRALSRFVLFLGGGEGCRFVSVGRASISG